MRPVCIVTAIMIAACTLPAAASPVRFDGNAVSLSRNSVADSSPFVSAVPDPGGIAVILAGGSLALLKRPNRKAVRRAFRFLSVHSPARYGPWFTPTRLSGCTTVVAGRILPII